MLDASAQPRELEPLRDRAVLYRVVWCFALAFALFHVLTAGFGYLPNIVNRSVHVGGGIILAYFLYSSRVKAGKWPGPVELAGIAVALVVPVWLWLNYNRYLAGISGANTTDIVLTVLYVVFLLEAARRVIGSIFVVIVVFFLAYAYLGNWFPPPLTGAGLGLLTVVEMLFMGTDGIWGTVTAVTANTVGVYIVMGEVLLVTGGGRVFIDLATRIAGRSVGGPAKVAVIASSMFGMLSGAPAANAAVTGNFTIPLMKRRGYSAEYAAAVEAVASSGSQIVPPVMGAAAFIMAEFLGISYLDVVVAAVIPALLFYATVFFGVHLHGQKNNIRTAPEDMPPTDTRAWWIELVTAFILPVGILLYVLLQGYTPGRGAFAAIVVSVIVYLLGDLSWNGLRHRLSMVVKALVSGGCALVLIALLAGAAQIVVGLISLTGFGVKLSSLIIAASGDHLFLALVFGGLVAMVLGMGMPTVAVYILAAAVVAPALIQLGVQALAAHMFLLYYGLLAALTPPVCVAVFITAGIAQADWLATAWNAVRLGLAKFIIPFVFVYSNQLLMQGSATEIVFAVVTALVGTYALSAGTTSWLRGKLALWQSAVLILSALLLFIPNLWSSLAGLVLLAAIALQRQLRDSPPARTTT